MLQSARRLVSFTIFSRRKATQRELCKRLESKLNADPSNVAIRNLLIQHYHFASVHGYNGPRATRDKLTRKHAGLVIWFAQYAPEDLSANEPLAFLPWWNPHDVATAKGLWMGQAQSHPGDARVLINAASFLKFNGDVRADRKKAEELIAKAEELAMKAHSLDPENPQLCATLAHVLESKISLATPGEEKQLASRVQQLRKQVGIAASPQSEHERLHELAKEALAANDCEKAQKCAEEFLRLSQDCTYCYNDVAFHHGNLILGRIALKKGELNKAKAYLLEAGMPFPTLFPSLPGWGPNMMLAKELLEIKENKVVLKYFDQCEKFWPQKKTLREWRKSVRQQNIPEFGVSLIY